MRFGDHRRPGTAVASDESMIRPGGSVVNLAVWIPVLVLLGLATLGLMFAFVVACEKV
jgi:hypothetical protein